MSSPFGQPTNNRTATAPDYMADYAPGNKYKICTAMAKFCWPFTLSTSQETTNPTGLLLVVNDAAADDDTIRYEMVGEVEVDLAQVVDPKFCFVVAVATMPQHSTAKAARRM